MSSNVEVLGEWAKNDTRPEDRAVLASLVDELSDTEHADAWKDPAVRESVRKAGEEAVRTALDIAKSETIDNMNEHWSSSDGTGSKES